MASAGELAALCDRHGVALLVVFGSAVDPQANPGDMDVAVRFATASPDVLGLLDELSRRLASDDIDLMDLEAAGPVAREHALVGARPLYQQRAGEFANAQIAAIMERMDTDWLRRLDLELMSR